VVVVVGHGVAADPGGWQGTTPRPVASGLERRVQPVLQPDEPIDPDHYGVRGTRVIGIVPRQLEAGITTIGSAPGPQRLLAIAPVRRGGRRTMPPSRTT
jgi:hypothetical protein